jgi:hemerythrin-like domain-containing protein
MSAAIEMMVEEHQLIKRMLKILRMRCWSVLKSSQVDYGGFARIIDFVRNFADQHHHSKEETILFEIMSREMGEGVEKGPVRGMLVEHDLGRRYISRLEDALAKHQQGDDQARLDIIANAISYSDLLSGHIDREDKVLYNYAERGLSDKAKEELDNRCRQVEESASEKGLQDKYRQMLEEMELKSEH